MSNLNEKRKRIRRNVRRGAKRKQRL